MLTVEGLRTGVREYLANNEEKLSNADLSKQQEKMFDRKQFLEFCKENNLSKKEQYSMEAYLNNGQSHFGARMSESVKEVFGVDKYSRGAYEKLLNGENPGNKNKMDSKFASAMFKKDSNELIRKNKNQKAGYGLVSTPPKSVSILFALSDDSTRKELVEVMFKTSEEMVKDIATQLKPSTQRKEYLDFDPTQTKAFATYHLHTDARPDEKNKANLSKEDIAKTIDTQLHPHITLANTALFAFYQRDKDGNIINKEDGTPDYEYKFLAYDGQTLMKNQLENSAKHDAFLNSELQKLGYKTEPLTLENTDTGKMFDTFSLVGVSREEEMLCSNRSQRIHEEAKKHNKELKNSAEYISKIAENTKSTKIDFTADELRTVIANNTLSALGDNKLEEILIAQETTEQTHYKIDYTKIIRDSQRLNLDGYITETKLNESIIRGLQYERTFDSMADLNKALKEKITELQDHNKYGVNTLIPVYDKYNDLKGYTRLSNAIQERSFMNNLEKLSTDLTQRTRKEIKADNKFFESYIEEQKKKGIVFNDGQLTAMKESLKLGKENGKVMLCQGKPGSGKTVSIIAFQTALHEYRYGKNRVIGISTGEVATKALSSANIDKKNLLNSTNFVKKAFRTNKKTGEFEINPKFVNDKKNHNNLYIFDEFGLEGSRYADLIQKVAILTNSTVSYVGDPNQLASVNFGSPIKYTKEFLDKNNPNACVVLDKILRQKNSRSLLITELYENKKADELFTHLKNENALSISKNETALLKTVATEYLNDKAPCSQKLIIATKNSTLDELNKTIRDKVKKDNLDPSIDYSREVKIKVARNGEETDILREMSFAPGERIMFNKGLKEQDPKTGKAKEGGWSIDNSELVIIKDIKRGQSGSYNFTVETEEGKTITFSNNDTKNFTLAYATTVHKSQGMSKLNVYHIGENTTFNNSYVAGSRHTGTADKLDSQGNIIEKGELGYKLFLTEKNVETYKKSITKEQDKFSTLNDKDCDKAVDEFCFKYTQKNISKPQDIPEELKRKLIADNEKLRQERVLVNSNQRLEEIDRVRTEHHIKTQNDLQAIRDKYNPYDTSTVKHGTEVILKGLGKIEMKELGDMYDKAYKFNQENNKAMEGLELSKIDKKIENMVNRGFLQSSDDIFWANKKLLNHPIAVKELKSMIERGDLTETLWSKGELKDNLSLETLKELNSVNKDKLYPSFKKLLENDINNRELKEGLTPKKYKAPTMKTVEQVVKNAEELREKAQQKTQAEIEAEQLKPKKKVLGDKPTTL